VVQKYVLDVLRFITHHFTTQLNLLINAAFVSEELLIIRYIDYDCDKTKCITRNIYIFM
jgi:hypothetical protein